MNETITLTATERLVLRLLLEDAPAARFAKMKTREGVQVTDNYLSNLYEKLQPGVTQWRNS